MNVFCEAGMYNLETILYYKREEDRRQGAVWAAWEREDGSNPAGGQPGRDNVEVILWRIS